MAKSVPKLSGLIKSGAFSTTSEDDPPPLASGLQGTTSTTAPPNDLPHATEVGTGEVIEGGNRSFLVDMRAGGNSSGSGRQEIAISLSQLRVSKYNARKVRTETRIREVAKSLQIDGQLDPLLVYPGVDDDRGFFMILGGETRHLAAIRIGLPTLNAIVDKSLDPNDGLKLTKVSRILNDSTKESDLDRAMVAASLIESGYTQLQAAEAINVESHSQVQRLLKLLALPAHFIELGHTNAERFSGALAAIISDAIKKCSEDFAFKLLQSALETDISQRRLEQLIKAEINKSTRDSAAGARKKRIGTVDIVIPGTRGGSLDLYRGVKSGTKVVKLEAEVPEALAEEWHRKFVAIITAHNND